jgi:hypothetical protein
MKVSCLKRPAQLAPRFVGEIDLQVCLPNPLNVGAQHIVTLGSCTAQRRIALLRCITQQPDGDLYHLAGR